MMQQHTTTRSVLANFMKSPPPAAKFENLKRMVPISDSGDRSVAFKNLTELVAANFELLSPRQILIRFAAAAKRAHQRRFLANFVALLHAPLLRHRLDREQEETKRDDQNLYELVELEFHVCDLE